MDIQLKGSQLDGIQLTKLCRGTLPAELMPAYARGVPVIKTPILFVTAFAELYSEAELLAAGGDRVITKPVEFGQITIALTQLHLERTLVKK
jgi:CheY-like chemotaxis protein